MVYAVLAVGATVKTPVVFVVVVVFTLLVIVYEVPGILEVAVSVVEAPEQIVAAVGVTAKVGTVTVMLCVALPQPVVAALTV
ncbi:hypothetical protein PK28_16055 [Hymenobacter sp. DG25B]|nr:hypothetical protein PK28_16055 [Hymenobacter sp. DG25B]